MCGHVWVGNGSLCPGARPSTSYASGCAGVTRGRATSSCASACVPHGTGNARLFLSLERGQLDAILRPFLPKRSLRSPFPVSELGVQFRIFPTNQYILSINY